MGGKKGNKIKLFRAEERDYILRGYDGFIEARGRRTVWAYVLSLAKDFENMFGYRRAPESIYAVLLRKYKNTTGHRHEVTDISAEGISKRFLMHIVDFIKKETLLISSGVASKCLEEKDREIEDLKTMLRELKQVREAVEKYRGAINGR